MNVIKHIDDVINLYLGGQPMAAESLERGLLRQLERSQRPENRVACTFLREPASVMPERVESLGAAKRYLISSYQSGMR